MPTIEVIYLRFNLDKDDDRRLFEALKARTSSGKRNEYIKKLLLDCLVRSRDESRNPKREAGRGQDRSPALPATESGKPEPEAEIPADTEAAGIVSQFLQ
jgi:hypothetical protein